MGLIGNNAVIKVKRRQKMKTKKILMPTLMVLLATLFIAVIPTEAEGRIYEDTIRIHILANSDSEDDQKTKLFVRDAVLERYGALLSVSENKADAENLLSEKIYEIEGFANEKLRELGTSYSAKVTLSEEWYDTRDYESFSLPAGYYTSLRILIGEAKGENFWCVMFPPLCLDTSLGKLDAYSKAENALISKKYTVKFKILELISELAR